MQKLVDVPQVSEDLDSSTLVCPFGLYDPNILLAMLLGHALPSATTFRQLFKTVIESRERAVILLSLDEECSRSGVKYRVVSSLGFFVVFIVMLKRSDEATFGADTSQAFEMVKYQRFTFAAV